METNNESLLTKFNLWMKESVTLKLLSIGFLILLLLIPTSMITDLIRERQTTGEQAIREVSNSWSNEQTIKGPVLVIPYLVHLQKKTETKHAIFLPEELKINGKVMPEERKRGIFRVIVYGSDLQLQGKFGNIHFNDWNIPEEDILYQDAYLINGISDLRGIKENIVLEWNNGQHEFETGYDNIASTDSGIKTKVVVEKDQSSYSFKFNIKLNGSGSIHFTPVGKETTVTLQSTWTSPSFVGEFLPEERVVNNQGFFSKWKVLHFNRNYPQQWLEDENYSLARSATFGVDLLLTVDHYQKNYRSARYAVLIISLTFLIFFFIEVLNKKRIHPLQYILVGIALCVFYTLLLSLSEHFGFGWSYLISALATVGLISFYIRGILSLKISMITAGILSLLYGFIFIVLQLNDYALLAGSIGLFAAVATVMVLSRKIDWYEPEQKVVQ